MSIIRNINSKKKIFFERDVYILNFFLYGKGYIPRTYCEDNDPLDILVLCTVDVYPLTIIESKVLGVMRMID